MLVCQCVSVLVCQCVSVIVGQYVSASVCQCVRVSSCQCVRAPRVPVCQCVSVPECQCDSALARQCVSVSVCTCVGGGSVLLCQCVIIPLCQCVSVFACQCVSTSVCRWGGPARGGGVRASVATLVSMRSYELANYDEPGGLRRVWPGRGYTSVGCIAKRDSFKIQKSLTLTRDFCTKFGCLETSHLKGVLVICIDFYSRSPKIDINN